MYRVVITDIEPIEALWLKDQLVRDCLVMHEDFEWEYHPTYRDTLGGEELHHVKFGFRNPAHATFYQLKWS